MSKRVVHKLRAVRHTTIGDFVVFFALCDDGWPDLTTVPFLELRSVFDEDVTCRSCKSCLKAMAGKDGG